MPDGSQTPLRPGWINQWIPGFPFSRWPPRRPDRPVTLWPWPGSRNRPEVVVDLNRVMLADPDGNLVGYDWYRGETGPMGRRVYADRTPASRNF